MSYINSFVLGVGCGLIAFAVIPEYSKGLMLAAGLALALYAHGKIRGTL